jgi:hypothetical protein
MKIKAEVILATDSRRRIGMERIPRSPFDGDVVTSTILVEWHNRWVSRSLRMRFPMKNDPTLSELFKLENAQLEKFLALDFELLYTKPDNTPTLKAKIDTATDEISRLNRAIREAN